MKLHYIINISNKKRIFVYYALIIYLHMKWQQNSNILIANVLIGFI